MKRVSIKDVAEKAGVSSALVSYVLNGKFTERINKDTAATIKEIAQQLNYMPNSIAQSLKRQKTYTIGLLVSDISNPFSAYLARIIEDEASLHGYTLIIGSSDENEQKSKKLIELFINRQVDGFIIAPVEKMENQILELLENQVPLVLIDRYFSNIQSINVIIDNYDIAFKATQFLIDSGRKAPAAIIYQTELVHMKERLRGFKDANLANGLEKGVDERIQYVNIKNIHEEVENVIENFLLQDPPVDGILFMSNQLTIAGLKVMAKKSIKVPETFSLVAFDKMDAYDIFYSPISYISQPIRSMASNAVRTLIKTIENPGSCASSSIYCAELCIADNLQ